MIVLWFIIPAFAQLLNIHNTFMWRQMSPWNCKCCSILMMQLQRSWRSANNLSSSIAQINLQKENPKHFLNKQNNFVTVADKHRIITKAARPSNFIARNDLILLSVCNKSLKDFSGVESRAWIWTEAALFHSSHRLISLFWSWLPLGW